MANDATGIFIKGVDKKESTIFNTSVRGWLAILFVVAMCACVMLIVAAPYLGVQMPSDGNTGAIIGAFLAGAGASINHYFNQGSREGLKK